MPGQGRVALFTKTARLTAALVNGQYIAATEQAASDNEFIVDGIYLSTSPYVPCLCYLYLDDPVQQNFVTKSLDAGQDTFEGTITIPGGSALTFVWAGEVSGAILYAKVHYSCVQIVPIPIGKIN